MGRGVTRAVQADRAFEIAGLLERPDHPDIDRVVPEPESAEAALPLPTADLNRIPLAGSVFVDFSSPPFAPTFLDIVTSSSGSGLPKAVIGSTGLSEEILADLRHIAERTAILYDSNMSYGIAILKHLVREARRFLYPTYDVEIVETHHRHKRDAPSGTALAIGRIFVGEEAIVHGRVGKNQVRAEGEVAIHAQRRGGVVGDHAVHFSSEVESLAIEHRAHSRDVFVAGALAAAKFLHGKNSGFYTMADLFTEDGS